MSIQFETKETINVPREKVYQGLLDLDSAKHWMQGLVRIERLDEGPMQVGSGWKETRKMMGQEATEVFKVTGLENNKIQLYVDGSKGTSGKGEHFYTFSIEEIGNTTEVTLHGEIKGMTGIAKLVSKLMTGTFRKICAKDLYGLKNYLEK
ncbi:SRPBCC family protein [Pseudalkalibacillus berkeleyi]|uniref:SRPBCC family protein n=1 Tax=Pseudalkalibacillus berkeleyi TaxID=1069813 RepID=A0ABS9H1V6_9BACL|nr:SRPBCC family protein [Pseudalkalibacillus berkeleyi]MCF6138964.1 SRPBCC family protein [Pseudalkalibacillus berkeleyi]